MEMADDGRKKCRRVFTKDKLMTDTPRNVFCGFICMYFNNSKLAVHRLSLMFQSFNKNDRLFVKYLYFIVFPQQW